MKKCRFLLSCSVFCIKGISGSNQRDLREVREQGDGYCMVNRRRKAAKYQLYQLMVMCVSQRVEARGWADFEVVCVIV
jgi:hypothetical protein